MEQTEITSPFVSILVTCFNAMPHIQRAIDSLVDQTYDKYEIVVIDDQSEDGTYDFLLEKEKQLGGLMRIAKNPSKGRGRALNYGLKICNGELIAINDADDISLPHRLERQVSFMRKNPEYGLVGSMSKVILLDNGQIMENSTNRPKKDRDIRRYFLVGQPIQHVTVMFKKKIVLSVGGYNEKINFLFDRDIFIRIAQVSKVCNLEDCLVFVGDHRKRFFKSNYIGIERSWMSTKYQLKAVDVFKFPQLHKIEIILKFIWSLILTIFKKK